MLSTAVWNYNIDVGFCYAADCFATAAGNATIAFANAHPERSVGVTINRAQIPHDRIENYQNLSAGCYAQNAQKQFITCSGEVTTAKVLRPLTAEMAEAVGCPDSQFAYDGELIATQMRALDKLLTRPIDVVNNDGEIFVSIGPGENWLGAADPAVAKEFQRVNASRGGSLTWEI